MTQTIRLDDETMDDLRRGAELHSRSLAMQAKHWMRIGKAMERSCKYSNDDIAKVLLEQSEPVVPPNEKKGSVTDRVEARLLNPTAEDEARFQEHIRTR